MKGQDLYKLDFQSIPEEICNIENDDNKIKLALLWHKRLGYMNFKDLHKFSRQGIIDGLPQLPLIKFVCSAC
jgi:hypothetical protein